MASGTYNGRDFYWVETPESRSGDVERRNRKYFVWPANRQPWDEQQAFDAVRALVVPQTVNAWRANPNDANSPLYVFNLTGLSLQETESCGYEIEATYSFVNPGTPVEAPGQEKAEFKETDLGSASYEYDTTLESATFEHSRARPTAYHTQAAIQAGNPTTPDLKNAINVDSEGEINGVEVLVPTTRITIRYEAPQNRMTAQYRQELEDLVGKVNLDTYLNRAPGTLLLEGVTGAERVDGSWSLQFSLRYRPNRTNVIFGDPASPDRIVVPTFNGWEYLWFFKKEKVATINGVQQIVPDVTVAYKHTLYDSANFNMNTNPNPGPLPEPGFVDL